MSEITQLQAENAKLQEELSKWERLTAGIDLPEYPVTQFKPKDLERENAKLQDENVRLRSCLSDDAENARMIMGENAKLRELVRKYAEYIDQDRCEGCACKSRCNDGDVDECWQLTEIRKLARELGVEVDG